MSLQHTIKYTLMPFRLFPKILHAIDTIFGISKAKVLLKPMLSKQVQ
jgi:hypothetical protein